MIAEFDEKDVYGIIARQLGVSQEKIEGSLEKTLIELGADSLDVVELETKFEEEFGIVIKEDEIKQIDPLNIKNFAGYIREKAEAKYGVKET